jgi:hypothetical protein
MCTSKVCYRDRFTYLYIDDIRTSQGTGRALSAPYVNNFLLFIRDLHVIALLLNRVTFDI